MTGVEHFASADVTITPTSEAKVLGVQRFVVEVACETQEDAETLMSNVLPRGPGFLTDADVEVVHGGDGSVEAIKVEAQGPYEVTRYWPIPDKQVIVVVGDLIDGHTMYGPFVDHVSAAQWADDEFRSGPTWWLVDLKPVD